MKEDRRMNFVFSVCEYPDYSAGILGFSLEVSVTVSPDSFCYDGDFIEYLRQSIAEYYDGACVELVEN